MKIGSICEVIRNVDGQYCSCASIYKGSYYTIRDILENPAAKGDMVVRLNEIYNPIHKGTGIEYAYPIDAFREIEFPPSIF